MNKIFEIGRLTKDPELRFTPGEGKAVCNFSIAVDDGWGDNKKAYFFNVVVWGKSAEAVASFTHKGSKVAVIGKLTTRDYEANDGTKRYVTEILADQYGGIEFLDSKADNQQQSQGGQQQNQNKPYYDNDPDMTPVDDGDIPF